MKKSFLMLAIAALLIPAFSSCKKVPKEDTTIPEYNEPAAKATQGKFTLNTDESASVVKTKDGDILEEIELTNKGEYIAKKKNKKAPLLGTYTAVAAKAVEGNTYELSGLGKFTVTSEGGALKVVAEIIGVDAPVTVTGKAVGNASWATTALWTAVTAVKWSVDEVTINFNASDIPAGLSSTFTGCDIEAIANWAVEKGLQLDKDKVAALKGYKVKYIEFTEAGTIKIFFEGKDAFIGDISNFDASTGKFVYEISSYSDNYVIAGKANGTVGFYNGKLALNVKGDVDYGTASSDRKYSSELIFALSPIL
ncbi:MAG: hypothetical protein IJ795_04675 [Bacteroidales bacterium]|nr:hypothetical protein [Bacteroidales bacterium]